MIIESVVNDLCDELCLHCSKYITSDIIKPNYGWVCEGSYCEEAEESFYNTVPIGIKYYRKHKLLKINERRNKI